jgi:hypothetical protein
MITASRGMMTIIADILTSYGERYDNPEAQKELWRAIARIFPPKLNHETSRLPSRIIAREGGDLGLSLLWIVQASLIGGIFGNTSTKTSPCSNPFRHCP